MARVSDAHLEARRQSILAAATRVFSQKGIAAATMAEIASEAGISPGAIYRYFENKEQLAKGCMNESSEAIQKVWLDPASSELSFNELAHLTFAELNRPEEAVDTQMFLEQALIAVRDGNTAALDEFTQEHHTIINGIRYLMSAEYGSSLAGIDANTLGEALYSFYWGARLLKLLLPEIDPVAQLGEIQRVMNIATARVQNSN
jgi:AcrR family transcriptional regulator